MHFRKLTQHKKLETIFNIKGFSQNAVSNKALILPVYQHLHYLFPNQKIEQIVESRANRQFFIKFRLVENTQTVLDSDKVYPQIIIENSTDGSIKPKVGVGYVRLICANGMLYFDKMTAVNIQRNELLSIEKFLPIFEALEEMKIQEASELATFRRLAGHRIGHREINWISREVRRDRRLSVTPRLIDRALLVATSEANELNTSMSAWLFYNGFNHAFNHIPFAFGNLDLKNLDGQVLTIIERVIKPNYRPIIEPSPFKKAQPKKSVYQRAKSRQFLGAC